LLHLGVDGCEGSFDIGWIDPRPDHKRALCKRRIERAVCVVGHALTLTDVVGQPSAEPELTQDVVHHPVAVIPGVETADGREAVGDVGLRLPRHGNRGDPAACAGGGRRNDAREHIGATPPLELSRRLIEDPRRLDVTDDDE
jgi:hypothetical protein